MTTAFAEIHPSVLRRFRALMEKDRLAHAYLFRGPRDVGKGVTALALAQMIHCAGLMEQPAAVKEEERFFCGVCPDCRKIVSGNHPDVRVLEGGGEESIKIEQIRDLLSQVKLRPFSGRKKIFILKGIENMTLEAANAFLKTLEEPSASSVLLLTTAVPEKVLDTVKSRCHTVHFLPLPTEQLAARLGNAGEEALKAHFLAHFSEGCPGRAGRLKENGLFERKNALIDRFLLRSDSDVLMKKILADKKETREFVEILLSWMRDCLLLRVGIDSGRLIHVDRITELRQFQERYTFEEMLDLYRDIVNMCRLLADNLNIKIPLAIIKTGFKA